MGIRYLPLATYPYFCVVEMRITGRPRLGIRDGKRQAMLVLSGV